MANIQNLKVIQDESGAFLGGAITPIDLAYVLDGNDAPKKVTGVYIKIVGTIVTEYANPVKGGKFVTKIINPSNNKFAYLDESPGNVDVLLISNCDICTNVPTQSVIIANTCADPVHVSDCDKQEYLDAMDKIYQAVDGLEITAENINLNTEQININTDEVEGLLKDIKDLLIADTIGKDCITPSHVKDCDRAELLSKLDEIISAINTSSADEQAILNTISTKLDELVLIKDQLVLANETLVNIDTNTALANTQLDTVIAKLEVQIGLLNDLKAEAITANTNLTEINTSLQEINANILLIKDDIALIKGDISAIKTSVASIDLKLDTVISSLGSIETKLDTIHSDLVAINTTLQTEFDQTQAKLDTLIQAVNDKGIDCTKKVYVSDCDKLEYLDALAEIRDAINNTATDYTAILESIDTKLDELVLIKNELVTANGTLTNIETNTTQANIKLDTIISSLNAQITLLTDIKAESVSGNIKLDEIKVILNTINSNIVTIKDDIALIKIDISAIKTGVQSIDLKLDTVNTHLTTIESKLDTLHSDLITINSTLQSEFDQTQVKLDSLITAVNNKGVDCNNKVFVSDCDKQEYLDALKSIENAITGTATDYTAILTSIDTKLNDLSLIKAELSTANFTLNGIKTDTALINTNLTNVIAKLDTQIGLLTDLKAEAVLTNANLGAIKISLDTINTNIVTIKDDLALIKADVSAIKTSTASIDAKLTDVVSSLNSIQLKLDTLHSDLVTLNTTLQSEFDQTQTKLDEVVSAIEFAQDTFQLDDCDGTPIGPAQNVLKVVQLAKQTVSVCNVDELGSAISGSTDYSPIINKLEEVKTSINTNVTTESNQVEAKLDLLVGLSTPILVENKSYKITANQTITFEANKVFGYGAGVFAGTANYTEGGSLIGDYSQGESFGNGDRNNLILNVNPIIINVLAGGDVRISVLQIPSYSPIIS